MKIFILEDNEFRINLFKEMFKKHELTITESAKDAIEILGKGLDYNAMFLDHDLGGRVFVDSQEEDTGYQVAKFLSEKEMSFPVFIHSMNFDGAKNMKACIPKAMYLPFPYLCIMVPKWIS